MQGNPLRTADLRVHNQNIVLSMIHAAGRQGTSQSEVVHKTGLKAPTIFRIFSSLEEDGLIESIEGGVRTPPYGRDVAQFFMWCRRMLDSPSVLSSGPHFSLLGFQFPGRENSLRNASTP